MKKIIYFIFLISLLSILTACSCKHENLSAATCNKSAVCKDCGESVGEPTYEHLWIEATCLNPKTCKNCGETQGNTTNKHEWKEATCYEPKTCEVCGKTEGKKLPEHTWIQADCENPARCQTCDDVDGEPLGHTWIDATYTDPQTCTTCFKTIGEPKEKPELDTTQGLKNYLSTNYSEVETCAGKYLFRFECYENDISYYGYDFEIKVLPENDYLFSNIASYSTKYTSAQKKQAKSELKNYMYKMANDIMDITSKRIKMYYDASYDLYKHVSGGYNYNAYCTCANYDFSIESSIPLDETSYEKTPKTKFKWYPKNDSEQW